MTRFATLLGTAGALVASLLLASPASAQSATQPLPQMQAQAQIKPVLRSEIAVLSDIVTVGDFYSDAGPVALVPLFRAPDLGVTGSVPAEDVARRAQAAGLTDAGTDGLRAVTVHRRAEIYDAARLKTVIGAAIALRDANIRAEDLEVSFFRDPAPLQADPGDMEPVRVDQVVWSRTDGRFTVSASVATGGGRQTLSLTGFAREMVEVTVLAQPLSRGTVLKAEDLTVARLPVQQVPARAVLDPADVVGLAARMNMRPNSPLVRADFERPVLVARNERVTLTFEMPGMKLTSRGQAMEDGSEGDMIDIMNLQSKRVVPAIVVGHGQVRILAPNTLPAAAQVASLDGASR
ncbi:flagellar basal body P-ring formation chaperone FlgA [Roseibium aestuarii]|uniref:Flagellar basal body P-ring formation chaperone FlgA n=1 Tax=Roseibium aestuarii TaxID=2600299 RepID=A0ABW4JYW1_9HYPH|nr:flagellar basal body P-ring formation chaperone FlgA [Roseibium aestuarii]